jgi:hypothetical protein
LYAAFQVFGSVSICVHPWFPAGFLRVLSGYKFAAVGVFLTAIISATAAELKTRNVLLVTIDGLRWQEVFRGADEAYFDLENGGVSEKERPHVRASAWAETPEVRRTILMPFFWSEIVSKGQLIGNRDLNSSAEVTNAERISYPGYNELLTGSVDPSITSNFPRPNPNVTVLEWLDGQPAMQGRVVACVTWQIFPYILNVGRSRYPMWVSGRHSRLDRVSPQLADIQRWMEDVPTKSRDEHFDAFAHRAALDLIDTHHPRLLYVALGEPDTWAHGRRYDRYLDSTRRCDRFIRELWEKLQSLPQYRDNTTLIVTTDHGRGITPQDWIHHSKTTPRSNETWMAIMGPDTPKLGERRNATLVASAQVAATVAKFLGEDYVKAVPRAAMPIADFFPAE